MRRSVRKAWFLVLLAALACCGAAWALGEEEFGNGPLNEANFKAWPSIMPVVNHPSRVYYNWVNGNENFYYQGDTAALNDTLQKFVPLEQDKPLRRQVVLRPGPGIAQAFDGRKIPFAWNLHLIGGIARHLTTLEQGEKIWSPYPVLTIYVGGAIDLEKVEIPKSFQVIPLAELKKQVREALKSKDKTVRGWGAGELAALDPYDTENRDAIAALLKDDDSWVRLNAVHALPLFGKGAAPLLPMLRAAGETTDAQLKQEVPKSIAAIEKAEDRAAEEKTHRQTLERIERFLSKR